jgi:uncharacterized protein
MTHLPPELLKVPVHELKWKEWFVHSGRLRSGWRLLTYAVIARLLQVIAAAMFGISISFILMVFWSGAGWTFDQVANLLYEELSALSAFSPFALVLRLWSTVALVVIIAAFRRLIDKRSFRSLGLSISKGWWREALYGFAIAAAAWLVMFIIAMPFGGFQIMGFAWESADLLGVVGLVVGGLIFNVLIAIAEELDARGYVLQNLAEGIRFLPAVIVSSFYFGVIHLLNPGGGAGSIVGIFLGGLLFALGYFVTGHLWFPMGMHAAWNFIEGPVLGFPVRGLDMGGLVRLNITGPDWMTGGLFGPEAGLFGILIEIGLIAAIGGWYFRKKLNPAGPTPFDETAMIEDEEFASSETPDLEVFIAIESTANAEELGAQASIEWDIVEVDEQLESDASTDENDGETELIDEQSGDPSEADEEGRIEINGDDSVADSVAVDETTVGQVTLEVVESEQDLEMEVELEHDASQEVLLQDTQLMIDEDISAIAEIEPSASSPEPESNPVTEQLDEAQDGEGDADQGHVETDLSAENPDLTIPIVLQSDGPSESPADPEPLSDSSLEKDKDQGDGQEPSVRDQLAATDALAGATGKARRTKAKTIKAKSTKDGSKTKSGKSSTQPRKRKPKGMS